MELKLKKNGKLFYYGSKEKNKNVTNDSLYYFMVPIEIEKGTTLHTFLSLFKSNTKIHNVIGGIKEIFLPVNTLDGILTFCWFNELMVEAFREDKEPVDKKDKQRVVKLHVSKNDIEIHNDTYSFVSDFGKKPENVTIEPYTVGNNYSNFDGADKSGVRYGIWPSSISKYMDCELVLDKTFNIREYKVKHDKKKKRNVEYESKCTPVECTYRMIDVLYAIAYEMTFDGVHTLEDAKKVKNGEKTGHDITDTLNERLIELKENGNEIDAT